MLTGCTSLPQLQCLAISSIPISRLWKESEFQPWRWAIFMSREGIVATSFSFFWCFYFSPPRFHRWVINVKLVATLRSSTIFLVRRDFSKTNWTFPTLQSERQSAVMERQRRCWGQNLESLITDPPPALLLHLKISDPDTLHSALDPPYTVIGKINVVDKKKYFSGQQTNTCLYVRHL